MHNDVPKIRGEGNRENRQRHVGCDYMEEMKSNEYKNGESSEMSILCLFYCLIE